MITANAACCRYTKGNHSLMQDYPMSKHRSFFLFFSMLLLGLALTACGAGAAPTARTSAPASVSQPAVAANTTQNPQIIEFYTDW